MDIINLPIELLNRKTIFLEVEQIKGAQFDCMTRFEGLKFEGGELEGMSFLRPNSPIESQAAIQYR